MYEQANCNGAKNDSDDDNDSVASFKSAASSCGNKLTAMLPHELRHIEQKLASFMYIKNNDAKYHQALRDMQDQYIISLVVQPSLYGRHQRTAIIAVATANNTYIFDIQALGNIFQDFKLLLKSERPRKIVHYNHRVCDNLLKNHKLKLNGVIDTFVLLCLARKSTAPCSLPEAIAQEFQLPLAELLCDEINGPSESSRWFLARPLSEGQLCYLAKMAIFQHHLYDRLLHDVVCGKVLDMSLRLGDFFSTNPDGGLVAPVMGVSSEAGFACINENYEIEAKELLTYLPK